MAKAFPVLGMSILFSAPADPLIVLVPKAQTTNPPKQA
jgi:hypothetical protein